MATAYAMEQENQKCVGFHGLLYKVYHITGRLAVDSVTINIGKVDLVDSLQAGCYPACTGKLIFKLVIEVNIANFKIAAGIGKCAFAFTVNRFKQGIVKYYFAYGAVDSILTKVVIRGYELPAGQCTIARMIE